MPSPRPLLLLIAACRPGSGSVPPSSTNGSHPPGSSLDPTDPTSATAVVSFSGLEERLHDDFGSVVVVRWTQDQPAVVHAEFSADPGVWLSSPARTLEAGPHEELLLGVPYDADVTWRLVAENPLGTTPSEDRTIRTDRWPDGLPYAEPTIADATRWDAAMPYVLTSITEDYGDFGDAWWVVVLDRQARPVWALHTTSALTTMHPRVARDGRSILIDNNGYWGSFPTGGDLSTVTRMTLDGTVLETWETPGLHHAFTDLPDGTIAYGAYQGYYSDELLIEVAPDRSTRTVFSCESWLDDVAVSDWCGSNTVSYDERTDRYLFSMFSFETILEVDRSSGEVTRWFGNLPGSYAFDPPSAGFWWQHGGYWTEEGTLLTSTHNAAGDETIVREYEADDAAETLHLVWEFGAGDGVYGAEMGEAHKLPSGHVLHNTGTHARLREGLSDGTVVWDVWWPDHDLGRSVAVADLYALVADRP